MSYGFEIRDVAGNLVVSNATLAWRWLDTFLAGRTESSSKSYSGLEPNSVLFAFAQPASVGGGHIITVSGLEVAWQHFHGGDPGGGWVDPYSASYISVFVK